MNIVERIKMVKAMEFIARQINDEDVFEGWLVNGVADGDIEYGDLEINADDMDEWGVAYYCKDKNFSDLMDLFLSIMSKARRSGGLYCNGIVSEKEYKESEEE